MLRALHPALLYVPTLVDVRYLADHITLPDHRYEIRIKNSGKKSQSGKGAVKSMGTKEKGLTTNR